VFRGIEKSPQNIRIKARREKKSQKKPNADAGVEAARAFTNGIMTSTMNQWKKRERPGAGFSSRDNV